MASVQNLDRLINKLTKLQKSVNLTEPLTKACLLVENDAKINAPVDTGMLRNSISHRIEGDTGIIGTNQEYAPYVEFGTGVFAAAGDGRQERWSYMDAEGNWHTTIGQHPQPFLEPALKKNKKKITRLFEEYLKEEFAK